MIESQLQQQMIIWFRNEYQMYGKGLIFSVPNGGSRNIIEAKNLKLTGSMSGVSDLIVLLHKKCLFIEVKIEKGIQSDAQKIFETKVTALRFEYKLIRTLEQFKNEIKLQTLPITM